jgi:hypothetical protein
MAHRSAKAQATHDKLVQQLADMLKEKHFRDVRADLAGHVDRPSRIFRSLACPGAAPDVTAVGIQNLLFEVETADSLLDGHIEEEWRLFASYARNRSAEFWVVVPKESKQLALSRMEQLGLEPRVMGI